MTLDKAKSGSSKQPDIREDFWADAVAIGLLATQEREGWYSPVYGQLEPAPNLSVRAHSALPFECVTLLWPVKGAAEKDVTLEREGGVVRVRQGGRVWEVEMTRKS